jgi:hemerythrin
MVSTRPSTPSINVHVLDDQHAVLIENIERLEQAISNGQGAADLPQIIREVAEYAAYHCPTEERLMASYDYPLRDLHAMEHRKFFDRLGEIERMVKEGHATAAAQTLSRLRGWLDRHIMDWDARLGEFLNRCGVD